MNLAEAYPANLREWIRGVELDRAKNIITVRDRFTLQAEPVRIAWSLMTCRKVELAEGKLTLLPRKKDQSSAMSVSFNPALLAAEVETMKLSNTGLVDVWGPEVYRILLKTRKPMQEGEIRMGFQASGA
jgi:hypothetical protein